MADKLSKAPATIRNWLIAYNLDWPLFTLDEAVALIDVIVPYEVQFISDGMAALLRRPASDIIGKPAHLLRPPGFPSENTRREAEVALGLARDHAIERRYYGTCLGTSDGTRVPVDVEIRYAGRADAWFLRATPIEAPSQEPLVFNVESGLILRHGSLDQVELVDLERLYNDALPKYEYRGGKPEDMLEAGRIRHAEVVREFLNNVTDAARPD